MKTIELFAVLCVAGAFAGCGEAVQAPGNVIPGTVTSVTGTMSFVLGGTSPATSLKLGSSWQARPAAESQPLNAKDEYIVSPGKAKINFTQVVFRGAAGETLATSNFTGCNVTYDRSLASGSTLLDCAFTAPVTDVYQIAVYYDKTVQLLLSDSKTGIYTNPASPTGFSTSAPAGGPAYVPYTVLIGDGTQRATPIIFSAPVTITATSTPRLYITTDMIHTVQLKVDSGGITLSPNPTSDPVAMFGGVTRGTSLYYSQSSTIESVRVQGFASLRIFYNEAGNPVYLIGPTCGVLDGPKGAWASPPIGATIGGWLGKDGNKAISWALPTTTSYGTYAAYFVMPEQTVLGGTTTLNCKATASPPAPADGKTYASGAPLMALPDTRTVLTLLAK